VEGLMRGLNILPLDSGIQADDGHVVHAHTDAFKGKTVLFTGTLTSMPRSRAEELVVSLGGKNTKTVTKKVDLVVLGDSPGSKAKKAIESGLKVIDESDFLRLVSGTTNV